MLLLVLPAYLWRKAYSPQSFGSSAFSLISTLISSTDNIQLHTCNILSLSNMTKVFDYFPQNWADIQPCFKNLIKRKAQQLKQVTQDYSNKVRDSCNVFMYTISFYFVHDWNCRLPCQFWAIKLIDNVQLGNTSFPWGMQIKMSTHESRRGEM